MSGFKIKAYRQFLFAKQPLFEVKDLHQFLHSKLNLSGVHLSQGHSNGWHLGMWNKQLGFTIHRWAFGDSSQKCGCNGVGDGS